MRLYEKFPVSLINKYFFVLFLPQLNKKKQPPSLVKVTSDGANSDNSSWLIPVVYGEIFQISTKSPKIHESSESNWFYSKSANSSVNSLRFISDFVFKK